MQPLCGYFFLFQITTIHWFAIQDFKNGNFIRDFKHQYRNFMQELLLLTRHNGMDKYFFPGKFIGKSILLRLESLALEKAQLNVSLF